MGLSMQVGSWLIWYVGGYRVFEGIMTVGELFAFVGLLGMFYQPFTELLRISRWGTESLASAQRIFDILDVEPEKPKGETIDRVPQMRGHVHFDNVTFGYEPLKPVLKNFSLEVEPGEMIGLVGHSGAGKTTTTNLILNFYTVDEGELRIDGLDVDTIDRDDLRRQVAAVPQEPYLFAGSVAENIAYGKSTATPEEIITAAMAANAHEFIMNMPDGYDSAVGEQGQRMSTGERQRMTIARAIVCNPRILILDEATSSVDTDTEKQIQEALDRLVRDRTTFAIAHRLSTLRNADRLVVLKNGTIEEVGSHEELMERGGEYRRLVELQSELSRIATVGG
jgi:ATP-binding cassette subfamily B protein